MKAWILGFFSVCALAGCFEDEVPESNGYRPSSKCVVGERRCIGDAVHECTQTGWAVAQNCPPGECYAGVSNGLRDAECGEEDEPNPSGCTQNAEHCAGNKAEMCDAGEWITIDTCTASESCEMSGTSAVCAANTGCFSGQQRCSNDQVQECSGGTWETIDPCIGATCELTANGPECAANETGVCDGSATYVCDGDVLVICDGTTESSSLDCSEGGGWCYEFGGAWEGDCVLPIGEACTYDTEDGMFTMACGTSGTPSASAGCDINDGCVTGISCDDIEGQHCVGNRIYVGCNTFADSISGQAVTFDCDAVAGGAASCELGQCVHSVVGEDCITGIIACGAGYVCTGETDESAGTCQAE